MRKTNKKTNFSSFFSELRAGGALELIDGVARLGVSDAVDVDATEVFSSLEARSDFLLVLGSTKPPPRRSGSFFGVDMTRTPI